MASHVVKVNRAPVMTLWGQVVAERLGHDRDTALTLGKGVAGLNAQAKGRRLGIYTPSEGKKKEPRQEPRKPDEQFTVELLGRQIPVRQTADGVRALTRGQPITPASVAGYLKRKFGDDLDAVRAAMAELAESYSPDELEPRAYDLYTEFRPAIAPGTRGWGQKGELDLERIRSLAHRR